MKRLGLGARSSLVAALVLSSCATPAPLRTGEIVASQKESEETEPMYRELDALNRRVTRSPASAQAPIDPESLRPSRAQGQIAIYLDGQAVVFAPGSDVRYQLDLGANHRREIEKLKTFLKSLAETYGIGDRASFDLTYQSQNKFDRRVIARFKQSVTHGRGPAALTVPIEGAGLSVILEDGRVTSITSSVINPPDLTVFRDFPGIGLDTLSTRDQGYLVHHVEKFSKPELLSQSLERLARLSNQAFDFAQFRSKTVTEKAQVLSRLFRGLGSTSTGRFLVSAARAGQLSFSQHQGVWYMQVEKFLGLALQIDFEIGRQGLSARHLREMIHDVNIQVSSVPNFPQAPEQVLVMVPDEVTPIAGSVRGGRAAQLFQASIRYFKNNFGWIHYRGNEPTGRVLVAAEIATKPYDENAGWVGAYDVFMIGRGGSRLHNFDGSPSVIGHEFVHAVIDSSSRLVYAGQSGALNEHFADLFGADIESFATGRPFDYTVGEEVIQPQLAQQRKILLDLIFASKNVSQDVIRAYSLNQIALRHMFEPSLSFSESMSHVRDDSRFLSACVPSKDNDNCGVHYMSGIANKATALIVAQLGMEKMRKVFFNTMTARLTPRATFQEYARQLYEECLAQGLDPRAECSVIVQSFESVGVSYPSASQPVPRVPAPRPVPQQPPAPQPPPPAEPMPLPEPKQPSASPLLKMCGWISVSASRNVTVIDNKYDTAILVSQSYQNRTQGSFQGVYDMRCGCVQGRISQTQNSKGTWFNYFSEVVALQPKDPSACRGIEFK